MCGVYERTDFCVDRIHGKVSAETVGFVVPERTKF